MSYTTDQPENPVGPPGPSPLLKIPRWQVLIALLVLAILVSAFKFYEQHYIAPFRPVQWQAFSIDRFIVAQRRQRSILIMLEPAQEETRNQLHQATRTAAVQKQIYLERIHPLSIGVGAALDSDDDMLRSIAEHMVQRDSRESAGGFIYVAANRKQPPRFLEAAHATSDNLIKLMDSEFSSKDIRKILESK